MTAMTVPPPGWVPIGARELQASFRRNLRAGLALSGAGHLAVLGAVLWLRASVPSEAPRLNLAPVVLIPNPPEFFPPAFKPPPSNEPWTGDPPENKTGTPNLVDPKVNLPTPGPIDAGASHKQVDGTSPGPGAAPNPAGGTVDGEPEEHAVVPYDRAPVPTFRPSPEYPDWARDAGVTGKVVLHALVGVDGRVKRVTVVRGIRGLSEPAVTTIARWLFKPATFGGRPVAVWVEIPVEFRL